MSTQNRPLSPHLQVYRPQLTSVLSIAHRISGVALCAGALLLVAWLLALAAGPDAYARVTAVIGSLPGQVVVFLFTFALYFHFCNGIRHLVWDAGHGLELPTVYASGKAVIATSIVLTLITWAIQALLGGAA
jgi:succinate dehydrogenase / fumarate reductase cytochrome b subunit